MVLRKFSKELFMGVPLSTSSKTGLYYHPVNVGDRDGVVILSQARALAPERLLRRIGRIGESDFQAITDKWCSLIQKNRNPHKVGESRAPNGDLYIDNSSEGAKYQEDHRYEIKRIAVSDIEAVTRMRLQSWLDTYVNEAAGVTREWIEARNERQMSPEYQEARMKRFEKNNRTGWTAFDSDGKVIGAATPYKDEEGVQHVGALYVDKNWHGQGVGGALMQKVIAWSDPTLPIELGVVAYNDRAKAFYRKWGFEEIPGSEELFEEVMPEVKMIRKGDRQ